MAKRKSTAETPATEAPALRLEYRSPAELAENPRNWRTHPPAQQAALAGVLSEVGWAGACLYNEATGRLIDGHARRKLAQEQGCERIPVLIGSWTEAQEAKILATLDPIAGMAKADPAKLREVLDQVDTACQEVADLLTALWEDNQPADAPDDSDPADAEPQIDRAAELQKQWGTAPGQLWLLGEDHRLLIGDCRKPEDVARLMGTKKINVAFTSPPYASQRKYDESSGFKPIPPDEYVAWWEPVQANVRQHLAADGSFFVNIKPHCEDGERVLYVFDLVLKMRRGWGWRFVDELCWTRKGIPGGFPNRFKNGFEPVFHFTVDDCKFRPDAVCVPPSGYTQSTTRERKQTAFQACEFVWDGTENARPTNVIHCSPGEIDGAEVHEGTFPIGLPSFFIRAFSDPGDVILDPFMGSGTTCIAAENHGRQSRGIEISAGYAAVILQRYRDAFPDQEIRLADGNS